MWLFFVLLGAAGWASVNVLDSVLVNRYEKSPMRLMWGQSFFSVPFLILLALTCDVATSWHWILLAFGIIAYVGDLWFFHVLEHVDVSVTNVAWSILSLFLSVAGFFMFKESWTLLQSVGAVLIVVGSLTLSLHNRHINAKSTLMLVTVLACIYLPYYIMKKTAIDAGIAPLTVFFWMILGRETLAFVLGWILPSIRRPTLALVKKMPSFSVINALVITSFIIGEFAGALAYARGPISLGSMISNVQPFMVIGFAWLLNRFLPSYTPKELLSRQSVILKAICFSVVFVGLALLSIPK
jgi:drug/metabolite transporter (DMT)-like permease